MKKSLLVVLFMLFFSQFVLADGLQQVTRVDVMPTDEEIMEIVKSYHLGEDREEAVFKDTKRKLLEMYEQNQSAKQNVNTNNSEENK